MTKIPNRLGDYRLMRHIRSGASTEIYHAIQVDSQQKRVLKALSPKALNNREKVQQLRHEYQVAGHLNHRNVLKVIEFSKHGPYAWIALEHFAGQSLRQMLSDKQRDALLERLPQLAEQMCQALWHLHQHGWAHCGVKPANFLINSKFDLKLIDFSLARRIQRNKFHFWMGKHRAIGSPNYMAPEQLRRQPVDERVDMYSLGCALFELIEGRVPYTGTSQNELLNKHLSARIPRVSGNSPHVTSELADLIAAMMAKRSDDRPPNMFFIVERLREIYRVAEAVEKLPLPQSNSMDSSWTAHVSGQGAGMKDALRASESKPAVDKAKRSTPSFLERWGRRVSLTARRRSIQVGCGLVACGVLAWFVLKPANDQAQLDTLERYRQIATSIAQPPEFSSQSDREAFWSRQQTAAQQASETSSIEEIKPRSRHPAQLELHWAAELLPAAVREARSPTRSGPSQASLAVNLRNAERILSERAAAREENPFGLYSLLDNSVFFWGLVIVDVIGAAWVAKLLFPRSK